VGGRPGPMLICIGGVHGNEPAGVIALKRVFRALAGREGALRGEFLGLAGNVTALERRCRYVDRDLNRHWLADHVEALRRGGGEGWTTEDREQRELLSELEAAFARARGAVHVVDLHTTSGVGPPFATLSDTLRNRAFGRSFPIPIVLGLEEQLEGTMLDYLNNLGHVTLGIEGGAHDAPESVDRLEAAVWVALGAAKLVRRRALPECRRARRALREAARGIPPVFEVRYRHAVGPDDFFRMNPGYLNFQPLARGEVLAQCRTGEVRAPDGGRILMPLYQELGDDGFFLVREIAPVWLTLSAILRRLRVDRLAPRLPGVRRHPEIPDAVVVDRRLARWFTVEIFHLLGYRREFVSDDGLVMSRRRFDLAPPRRRRG